jgi:Mor family transcriptional regulator
MTCQVLEELIESIGLPATIELTRAFGGRTLHVPKTAPPLHPLVLAVGQRAAETLCRDFACMALEIPSERKALVTTRNEAIVQAYQDGATVKGLAIEHQLSRKMIRKILRRAGVPLRSGGTGPTG